MRSRGDRPRVFSFSTYQAFFRSIPSGLRLVLRSPEILAFGVIQWLAIVCGYLIWVQLLRWIPDETWRAVEDSIEFNDNSGAFMFCNLAILAWSFLVICVVAYPISLCTAAMVAVHDLRTSGERVTFTKCIAVADKHLGRLWAFTIVDSWITVNAILDRLPKKHYHRTALDELLYYAWKISTAAVVPALVNGRTFVAAGRDSLVLLRKQTGRVIGLRLGYSAVCWVIGIGTYVSGFFLPLRVPGISSDALKIFRVYFVMALPICFAVAVLSVIVRPLYVLGVASLYTEEVDVRAEVERDVSTLRPWEKQLLSGRGLVFVSLAVILLLTVLFAEQVGLTRWIELAPLFKTRV